MRAVGSGESVSWILMGRVQGHRPRFLVCLQPPSPVGLLVGVGLSCVRYPVLSFSQPKGLSFVACLDCSGSSDALGELANGYDRVESRSVVHDGVNIALL